MKQTFDQEIKAGPANEISRSALCLRCNMLEKFANSQTRSKKQISYVAILPLLQSFIILVSEINVDLVPESEATYVAVIVNG